MMRLVRAVLGRHREQISEPHTEPRPINPCARCANCGGRYKDHPAAPVDVANKEHSP